MQLRISNIEQSVRRNIDYLVIGDALGEQVGAEREIAVRLGFQLLFEIGCTRRSNSRPRSGGITRSRLAE